MGITRRHAASSADVQLACGMGVEQLNGRRRTSPFQLLRANPARRDSSRHPRRPPASHTLSGITVAHTVVTSTAIETSSTWSTRYRKALIGSEAMG